MLPYHRQSPCRPYPKPEFNHRLANKTAVAKKLQNVKGAVLGKQHEYSDQQTHIADAVHDKGLFIGLYGFFLSKPKANEQVRRKTNQFPKNIKQQQVIGNHQCQHAETEKTEPRKIPLISSVVFHVAG